MPKRSLSRMSVETMPLRQYEVSLPPARAPNKSVIQDEAVGGDVTEMPDEEEDDEDDDMEIRNTKRVVDVNTNYYMQIFEQVKDGVLTSDEVAITKRSKSALLKVLNPESDWKFERVLQEKNRKLFIDIDINDRMGVRKKETTPVRLWSIHAPKNKEEYCCDGTLQFKEYTTLDMAVKDRTLFEESTKREPQDSYVFAAVIDSVIFDKIENLITKQGSAFEQFTKLLKLLTLDAGIASWSNEDTLEFRKLLVLSEIGYNESTKQYELFQKGRQVFHYVVFRHFASIFNAERLTNFCEVLDKKDKSERLIHDLYTVGSTQWLDVILYSMLDSNTPNNQHLLVKRNVDFVLNEKYDKKSKDNLVQFNQIWGEVREFFLPNVNTEKTFNTTFNMWLAGMLGFKVQDSLVYKMLKPEGKLELVKERFNKHIGEYLHLIDPNFNLGIKKSRQEQFKGADQQIIAEASNEITYIYEPYYVSWMRNLHSLFCSVDVRIEVHANKEIPQTEYFYVDDKVPPFRLLGLPTLSGFKSSTILNLNEIDLQIWMSLWMQSQLGLRQDELFNKTIVLPARKVLQGDDNLVQARRVSIFNTGKSSLSSSNDADRAIIRQVEELRESVKEMVWRQELNINDPLYEEKVNDLHSKCDSLRNESGGKITYIQEKPILSPDTTIDEIMDCVYRFILTKPKPSDAYANIIANQHLKRRPNFDDVEARLGGLRWTPIDDAKNQRNRYKYDGRITTHNLRALYSTYSYYLYAPPRMQELSWIVKQLGHASQQTLTTAVRYNSRRVWTGDNLKYSQVQEKRLNEVEQIRGLLAMLVDGVRKGYYCKQKNESPIKKLVRENLEVIDDELEQGWPKVEVARNNDKEPILMEKFKHNDSISPSYMNEDVPSKDRLQNAQENLFAQMAKKHVVLSPSNFKLLGYSKTHSYRIVQEAKNYLKIQ